MSRYTPSIFQGKFDFSHRTSGLSLTVEHPLERIALRVLLAALALCVVLYLYFIGASVFNVIARKEALSQTANLANAVSELERAYFTASDTVGLEEGARLGLTPVENAVYVYRPGNAALAGQAAETPRGNEI